MRPLARRPSALLVAAATLLSFALAATLAQAETSRRASTTFRGTWLCNWKVDGAFVPLAGARVELLTPYVDLDDLDIVPGNFRVVQVTHTGADGSWSFTFPSDEDGDDYWVRVLTNGNGVRMHDFLLPWPFFVDSDRNQNDVPLHDYGARVIHTYRCEVFTGLQHAYDDFVATTGKPPPYGDLDVVSHALTAGVPVTMFTEIWWPADYPVARAVRGTGAAYGYETAFHEFAHSFRHAYDAPRGVGGLGHFFGLDVPYWDYAQKHDDCKKTNSGFAFNEGWASYWAGKFSDGRAPACGGDGRDYSFEGNVTAALNRLQRLCRVTRADMVAVLEAAGPAGLPTQPIHTFDQFAAAANRRFSSSGSCLLDKVTSSASVGARRDTQRAGTLPSVVGRLRRDLDRTVASSSRALATARLMRSRPIGCAAGACTGRLTREVAVPLAAGRLDLARAFRKASVSWTPRERRVLAGPPSRAQMSLLDGRARAFRRAARVIQARMLHDAIRVARPYVRRDGSARSRAILHALEVAARTGSAALVPGIVPTAASPRVTRSGPSGDPPAPSPPPPPPPPPPPLPPKPNLVVGVISWPASSSDLPLSVTVRNIGEAPAPPSRVKLALGSSFNGQSGERILDVPGIPAGGQATVQTQCFVYTTDRATATADESGSVDESDESDNVLTVARPPCRYD